MRILLAVIFLSIVLTGSVFQSYEQTVERNGDSIIVKTMDIGLMLGMLGDDVEQKLDAACSNPALECSVSEGTLIMRNGFTQNDGYYTYEANYGIPFIEYQVVVKKIPVDVYTDRLEEIMIAAGLLSTASGSAGEPINLQDADSNRESAVFMKQTGLEIAYIVGMPAEIISADAGEISGSVDGAKAEFMLSEVLQESKPIVVRSRELNLSYLVIIIMIIVLAVFALSFVKGKKKR